MKLRDRYKERRFLIILMVVFQAFFFNGCSINYSFTGANLSPEIKTFTVYYFPNRAKLVNPTLSQTFTEDLKEMLQRQTSLNELSDSGDIEFEGQITDYSVRPMSIQKDDQAAQNRLTITVKVKYTDNVDTDNSFERTFSAFDDFDSSYSLTDIEDSLVPDIVKKLHDDIFNATIANW